MVKPKFNVMKKKNSAPKNSRSFLFSVFPAALIAAFGFLTFSTPQGAPDMSPYGTLQDTLPGDTIDDPVPSDTMGFPGDDPTQDTSAYPNEDFFPADTTDDGNDIFPTEDDPFPVDTAGEGETFEPMPSDTSDFTP